MRNKLNEGTITDSRNDELYQIFEYSIKYYTNNLSGNAGEKGRNYLETRGLSEEVIKEFDLGLALNEDKSLTNFLIERYSIEDLLESGLVIKVNGIYQDLFTNRIMFPIHDLQGRVVAYSGRLYDSDNSSKYINTKVTDIFKKTELLYNYHRAKGECKRNNQVIVVEGFMDVIKAYSVGIKNVVAVMGTLVTNEQAHLIKELGKEVILCFDGDDAGAFATKKCIDELSKIDVNPKVVRLEEGLDLDEYISRYGAKSFYDKVDSAVDSEVFISLWKEGYK